MMINPKRGEIWQVNLEPTIGQEIRKKHPVVVISSDLYSPIALRTVIPLTNWQHKFVNSPFMVKIVQDKINGLDQDSAGNVLQIRSLSTQRFIDKIGIVSNKIMGELLAGLIISIDYSIDN